MGNCKYCNKYYKKSTALGGHTALCNKNPKYEIFINKKINSLKKRKKYYLNCKKCNKLYLLLITDNSFLKGKYRKNCSQSCANSRNHSIKTKILISIALHGRRYIPREVKTCCICGIIYEISITSNQKTCSLNCGRALNGILHTGIP